jgi:6-phosphofructokinase 1
MRTFEDVVILESMGRDAGWLAAASGLGREQEDQVPHLLYLPEYAFDEDSFLADVQTWHRRLGIVFVVASESLRDVQGRFVGHSESSNIPKDEMGRTLYGFAEGTGSYLSKLVMKCLGLRARYMRPGPLGRIMSCCISETDRAEAKRAGQSAVAALIRGETGHMVTLERVSEDPYECQMGLTPLENVASGERLLTKQFYNVETRAITPAFKEYALPLIDGPLPAVTRIHQ